MGTDLQESSADWFKLTNEILNIKGKSYFVRSLIKTSCG